MFLVIENSLCTKNQSLSNPKGIWKSVYDVASRSSNNKSRVH